MENLNFQQLLRRITGTKFSVVEFGVESKSCTRAKVKVINSRISGIPRNAKRGFPDNELAK